MIKKLYNGQTPSRNHLDFWNGDIPWLTSGELNHSVVLHTTEHINIVGKKSSNLKIVPSGTFVMAITGLEASGTRGNSAILGLDTTINQSVMALFPNSLLNTNFLFQWYQKIGDKYGIRYTQGTKQQSYNSELIKILPITMPYSLKEQQAIGLLLKKIDDLIALQQRKIDTLKLLKKALLQQMFPKNGKDIPRVRIVGFNNVWSEKKLKEIATHRSGRAIEKYFSENGKYKVISIGSYGTNNRYKDQGIRVISNSITNKQLVKKNELTMVLNDKTANGTIIGRVLLINTDNEYVVNQRTEIISPQKTFNSKFAFIILNNILRKKSKE
ncbi:restriction endonuclease subunit S [Pediococcus pentosaceus]|uniref:restriction endonuclease subunit S n=1 Tax=Pediococcus pentosaceus TaxID=1255 RepID=UPI00155A6EF2